ncbi:hypothetical protein HYQ44_014009 [Verticillium longisporum]|nr:hypothetical protein HYQ44_014009 [Verticillium longisporum]
MSRRGASLINKAPGHLGITARQHSQNLFRPSFCPASRNQTPIITRTLLPIVAPPPPHFCLSEEVDCQTTLIDCLWHEATFNVYPYIPSSIASTELA